VLPFNNLIHRTKAGKPVFMRVSEGFLSVHACNRHKGGGEKYAVRGRRGEGPQGSSPCLDNRGINSDDKSADRPRKNSSEFKGLSVYWPPLLLAKSVDGILPLSCRPLERRSGPGAVP
jgi:hypothetical protein